MPLQCRVCLFKIEIDSSTDLFTKTRTGELIYEVLTSIAPVQIFPGDGLPDHICSNCEDKLNAVLDFRSLLISSNSKLQKAAESTSFNEQNTVLIEEYIKIEPQTIQEVDSPNNFVCDTCQETFPDLTHLENHVIHDANKSFVCHDCHRSFKHSCLLMQHMKLYHNDTGYKCNKCGELLQKYQSFRDHVEQHTKENISEHVSVADEASSSLLPMKSKDRYEKAYKQFCDWRSMKSVKEVDESVMLSFFYEKAKVWKASSLWSVYSMLKSTLQINESINIGQYRKLLAFLKRQNDTYEAKKSKILTMENIKQFLKEAPDGNYLFMKVVLIFSLSGGCGRGELCNLRVDDIEDSGSILVVTLIDTITKKKRIFTVSSKNNGYELYQRYARLRPPHVAHQRFFLLYKNGKCTSQPVGIKKFAKIPQRIAEFLHLPDANNYTGHCLRRTSATFLADV